MSVITNWGVAVISSLAAALALVVSFIPKLIGFLVILLIGYIVAKALEKVVTLLLKRVGFDRISDRIGLTRFEQQMNVHMDPASLLGRVVYWFVFLIFLVPACNALELTSVSTLIGQIVGYLPNVFVAIVVIFLGLLLATFVGDLVRGASASSRVGNPNILANIARFTIAGFAVLIALEQLQIAPALITTLFTAIVGSAALAAGLAFGLGGRDSAKRVLERSEGRWSNVPLTAGTTTGTMSASQLDMRERFNQAPSQPGRVQPETPTMPSAEQVRTEQTRKREYTS